MFEYVMSKFMLDSLNPEDQETHTSAHPYVHTHLLMPPGLSEYSIGKHLQAAHFGENINSESCLAPCNNFPFTFSLGRSSYFHFKFISITLMKVSCASREQESQLWMEVTSRLKINRVCIMKSVLEGLLFFCLGQVCICVYYGKAMFCMLSGEINICKDRALYC